MIDFVTLAGYLFQLGRMLAPRGAKSCFGQMPLTASFGYHADHHLMPLLPSFDFIAPYGQAEIFKDAANIIPAAIRRWVAIRLIFWEQIKLGVISSRV